jgi:uncharacterized protein YndB with AHSA1/START domain
MIEFSTGVRIARNLAEVFDYVSEPEHFPRWNSAVRAVHKSSGGASDVGTRYVMERDLPSGPAENELEVVGREEPTEFAVRTTSGPTPFKYRYHFSEDEGGTNLQLYAQVELGGVASMLGPLARRTVKKGVDDNLRTLKRLLESGAPGPGG